jgi:hypothetical protein
MQRAVFASYLQTPFVRCENLAKTLLKGFKWALAACLKGREKIDGQI